MNIAKQGLVAVTILVLVIASLLLSSDPVSAKTKFHFGLNLWAPLTPYYGYAYPYPPPPMYYPPVPYYRPHPPCAQIWVPGYYDPYGNWVFGYYRTECGYYGY